MATHPLNPMMQAGRSAILPISAACVCDVGQARTNNEDNFRLGLDDGIFIVSDGMGGHQSGEIASRIVVEILPQILLNHAAEVREQYSYQAIIAQAVLDLNQLVSQKGGKELGLHGMGATLALAWVTDERGMVHLANVGDSRIYYYHNQALKQISLDHSIVSLLLLQGEIQAEEARDHPARGRLYRYLGMDGEAVAEIHRIHMEPGDILLLCSDGLTDDLADQYIQSVLSAQMDLQMACQALVDEANRQGGKDNITAMLLKWGGLLQ